MLLQAGAECTSAFRCCHEAHTTYLGSHRSRAWRIAQDVWQQEGASGFYRGIIPTAVRVFFGAGVYFAMLDALSGGTAVGSKSNDSTRSAGSNMALGAAARAVAATLLNPVTVVKTRAEQALGVAGVGGGAEWRATTAAVRSVLAQGASGMTAGLAATILRDAPYSGVYFALYQALLGHVRAFSPEGPSSAAAAAAGTFAAAGAAGALATLLTQPFDMLRTRSQMSGAAGGGMLAQARGIVAADGVQALYRGAVLRAGKRSLSSGIVWTLLEGSSGAFSRTRA